MTFPDVSSSLGSSSLKELQEWMQRAIIGSPAQDPDRTVEEVILPSSQLTAEQRLQIYSAAYHARLLECLGEEFTILRSVLGDEAFGELAVGYLRRHPSQTYTLNDLGRDFPRFLRETRPSREYTEPDEIEFLIDLAAVERAYSEVFDGPGSERLELLTSEQLSGLTVEDWLRSRVRVVPCLRFLALQFPVQEFITARRTDPTAPIPAPLPTWLVVTRREYIVRRVSVPEEEFLMLQDLAAGMTVETALQRAVQKCANPDSLLTRVNHWFTSWTAAGYFTGIER